MRFDLLFDDLEAQLDAQRAAGAAGEHAEAERLRAARSSLCDRIAALIAAAAAARLRLIDGSSVDLVGATVGRDWLAVRLPGGADAVVPLASVVNVALGAAELRASRERMPVPLPGTLTAAPGIGVVLRDLARRRVPVDVALTGEGAPVHGTIDRVGSDHFDLAVHEPDAPRREASVLGHRIVALSSVALLRA